MTPEQQDIIGIVKELQKEHDGLTYLHVVEETGSDRAEICFHAQDAIHIVKLHHHLPAIAKALLIAVDCLEGIQETKHEEDALWSIKGLVAGALSRIRSLK